MCNLHNYIYAQILINKINIDEPEDDNDEEMKIYLSVFNPKEYF